MAITVNSMSGAASGVAEMELKGLSTDVKPTDDFSGAKVGVNSLYLELDTGDVYYFTGSDWAKIGG